VDTEEKAEKLFQIGLDSARKVIDETKSIRAPDRDQFLYRASMFFFLCKAFKTYQALSLVWREGFPEDALVLSRTIFELVLQARYMKQDPKPRALLFIQHDFVARYRCYEKLKKIGIQRMKDKEAIALREHHDKYVHNYKHNKSHWWGNSISWLAHQLGKAMRESHATGVLTIVKTKK